MKTETKIGLWLLMAILMIATTITSVVAQEYVKCDAEIDVEVNNNSVNIDMPGQSASLTCGNDATLVRNYNIEFFAERPACPENDALTNLSAHMKTFSSNFETLMGTYNITPGYYNEYLECSQEKAKITEQYKQVSNSTDWKGEYETCEQERITAEGERSRLQNTASTNTNSIQLCEEKKEELESQRLLALGAGLLLGIVGMRWYGNKERKLPRSDSESQLPSSR